MCPGTEASRSDAGRAAVVLVSGGMDSATTLAIARQRGHACHGLIFDYGQRHRRELERAIGLCRRLGAVSHHLFRLGIGAFGGSALTDTARPVPDAAARVEAIPDTYVPARNTVFLSVALAWAETLGARDLYIGANAVDYPGYPDCRPEFFAAYERLARVATRAGVEGRPVRIHAPLLYMRKSGIVRKGLELGVDFAATLSCYRPDPAGLACGRCEACHFRRKGFAEAGVPDPTRYVGGVSAGQRGTQPESA